MRPESRGASNKRKRTKTGSERPAASVDEQRVFRGNIVGPKKRDCDHPTGRRGPSAARHLADLSGSPRDLVAMDRRDVRVDSQAEQLAAHLAHIGSPPYRFLAHIAPFHAAEREGPRDLERAR